MFKNQLLTWLTFITFFLFLGSCIDWFKRKPKPTRKAEPLDAPSATASIPVRSTVDRSTSYENLQTIASYPFPPDLCLKAYKDIRGIDLPINEIDWMGYTALYRAVVHNDIAETRRLLRLGANPNIWGKRNIPLNEAFSHQNGDLIQLLLDNGAVIVDKKISQKELLEDPYLNRDPAIKEIVRNHFSGQTAKSSCSKDILGQDLPINKVDEFGYTDLYDTIMDRDISAVEKLLRLGANPNIWGRKKIPLDAAIRYGKKEVVQLLLDNRAMIVDESISKQDILNHATHNHPEIHTLLVNHLSTKTAVHQNYKDLHDPVIDINAMDSCGETVLYKAVLRKDIIETKRLLALGADPNVYGDPRWATPLGTAVIHKDKAMVQLLLDHGAAVIFNPENRSDMLIMARIEDQELLSMLLCQVASSGRKDDVLGSTPLHWACRDGYIKVVEHLFATDPTADVNDIDPTYNFTPIHWAAMRGHQAIVEFLLSKGASKTAKSKNGFTPLMLAITNEHNGLKELLAPDGFDREVKNLNADWTCSLCLEGLEELGRKIFPIVILDCKHKFHKSCIIRHVKQQPTYTKSSTCPNCRAPLSDEMTNKIKALTTMPSSSSFSVNYAVSKYEKTRLKALLANGGNVHDICKNRYSPLITAIREEHYDLVPLLIAFGSDVNYRTSSHFYTALHYAAIQTCRNPAMRATAQSTIIVLIQHGAIVNALNVNAKTPANICNQEDVQIFFEAGGIRSSFNDIQHAFDLGGSEEGRKILNDKCQSTQP